MKETIMQFAESIVTSDYALLGLFLLSFAESSFFPVPPDLVMIPLAVLNPPLALFYALITTLGSVIGGVFGFFIGNKGGKKIVYRFISEQKLYNVKLYYKKYDVWAVIVAAFSPIPYKVFSVSAGLFDLDLKRFIVASIIGRGGRFFIVGTLIFLFGATIKTFLNEYFELVTIGFTVLLIGGFIIANFVFKHKKKTLNKENNS